MVKHSTEFYITRTFFFFGQDHQSQAGLELTLAENDLDFIILLFYLQVLGLQMGAAQYPTKVTRD